MERSPGTSVCVPIARCGKFLGMGLLASSLVLSAGHAGDNNQGNNNNGGGQSNNNQGQEAGADRALRLLTPAPIPSAGADNNTAGGMYSFDISYVDQTVRNQTYLFSPGICWIGSRMKRAGSFVQALQMYS